MEVRDFVHRKIRYLVEIFPQIKCLYHFQSKTNYHIINIYNLELIEKDPIFIDIKEKIFKEFDYNFPSYFLFAISNKKLLEIESDFVVCGKQFKE